MLTDGVLHPLERLKNRSLPGEQMEQLLPLVISPGRALPAQMGAVRSIAYARAWDDLSLPTIVCLGGAAGRLAQNLAGWHESRHKSEVK